MPAANIAGETSGRRPPKDESTISVSHKDQLRERIKIEFYKTYDVMTGIRIAATLGGFFSMMILLVLYKNYCKPNKTLSEEQLNAAVTAAAEEEDRALQAALEATSFYTALEKRRQSLENANQVLLSPRFSSVGGGYSHLTPPLKVSAMQQRGKSLPGSVLQFSSNSSPCHFQKDAKSKCLTHEDATESHPSDFIPCKNNANTVSDRRLSSVTCSSVDSAYLERRCSAFDINMPNHFLRQSREKLCGKQKEPCDYYYHIDIQVIQPTPEMSPTASEKNLSEGYVASGLQVPGTCDKMHSLSVTDFDIGMAPLASISSLGGFSQRSSSISSKTLNNSTCNLPSTCTDDSTGSDSVFMDADELVTDSEFEYDEFNDDYSFCEAKQTSPAKTLKFASFDSYDTSIVEDSTFDDEFDNQAKHPSEELKNYSGSFEVRKTRRKLSKTYSEPKNGRGQKTLPPWTEKGRSGYVPKRQMSSPLRKRNVSDDKKPSRKSSKDKCDDPKGGETNGKDLTKFLLPPSSNCVSSDSVPPMPNVQRSDSVSTQGLNNDLPFRNQQKTRTQMSLPSPQERRARLQRQKNFNEESKLVNQREKSEMQQRSGGTEGAARTSSTQEAPHAGSILAASGGFLKPPSASLMNPYETPAIVEVGSQEDISDGFPNVQINRNAACHRSNNLIGGVASNKPEESAPTVTERIQIDYDHFSNDFFKLRQPLMISELRKRCNVINIDFDQCHDRWEEI